MATETDPHSGKGTRTQTEALPAPPASTLISTGAKQRPREPFRPSKAGTTKHEPRLIQKPRGHRRPRALPWVSGTDGRPPATHTTASLRAEPLFKWQQGL